MPSHPSGRHAVCCLCGRPIERHPRADGDTLSMDHVPPKQFFPKVVRTGGGINLWVVPTHKACNERYREDEEYFYHAFCPLVQQGNPHMGKTILRDLSRRRRKPQTPAMVRRIVKTARRVTEGGIHLPPGVVELAIDRRRIERVVIKIAQGLSCLDRHLFLPPRACKDIRLCTDEGAVPEMYALSWQVGPTRAVCEKVFSYRHFKLDDFHLWSMLFWEGFMFCTAFAANEVQDDRPAVLSDH